MRTWGSTGALRKSITLSTLGKYKLTNCEYSACILEVSRSVLLATIRKPALAIFGFAGNLAPLCFGNSTPQFTSTILLEPVWITVGGLFKFPHPDVVKVVSCVFPPTIWVPACAIFGLAGDPAP